MTAMKVLRGKDLAEFEAETNLGPLFFNAYLGLYSATATRYSAKKEKPIDRSFSALIYFWRKNPDIINNITFVEMGYRWQLPDLIKVWDEALPRQRVTLNNNPLDLSDPGHLGALLLKGHSTSRNMLADEPAGAVQATSIWIKLIMECIKVHRPELIEEIIWGQMEAEGIDWTARELLKKAWPQMAKE